MSGRYFNFFYQRFFTSTLGWKDDAIGAYVRLLSYQFDNDGLPNDFKFLCSLTTSLKKNKSLIMPKFKLCEDGKLRNEVMEQVFNRSKEIAEANSNNAKKRWQNGYDRIYENDATAMRPDMRNGCYIKDKDKEEEKENAAIAAKETAAAAAALQSDEIRKIAGKAFQDKAWCESVMMGHKVKLAELTAWMAQFNASLSGDCIDDFTERRYKKMFVGWLNKQKAKGYELNREKSILSGPPLKILN